MNTCQIADCPFHGRTEVPYRGPKVAEIMMLGESPGREEENQGQPFVGRSGKIARAIFNHIGYPFEQVFIFNAMRCRYDKKTDSDRKAKEAMKCCRQYVERAINVIQPKLIVTLGNEALYTLLKKKGITKNRGNFFSLPEFNTKIFATVHPAFVLRQGASPDYPNKPLDQMSMTEKSIFKDFEILGRYIKNGWKEGVKIDTSGYVKGTLNDLKMISKAKRVSVDFESNGTDMHKTTTKPLSVSFSIKEGASKVFFPPFPQGVIDILAGDQTKVVMARPFEEEVCSHKLGIELGGVKHDIAPIAHLLDENSRQYDQQTIANSYTDLHNSKDLAEGLRHDLENAPESTIVQYNGVDTDAALRSFNIMGAKLSEDKRLLRYYNKFLLPVQNSFAETRDFGCKIDTEVLRKNTAIVEDKINALHKKAMLKIPKVIKDKYRDDLKLSRPDLIRDYLFIHPAGLRLKPDRHYITPKTNVPSTKEDHLKLFPDVPFIDLYREIVKAAKIKGTYLDTLWSFIKNDGKVYTNYFFTRQATGRMTIKDPPVQTVPVRNKVWSPYVRECYVADEGWLMGARDLSQSQIRIMGWQSNDVAILTALRNGVDVHTLTASIVLGIPLSAVTEEQRQKAKAVNFGFLFRMSAKSFVIYAREEYGQIFTEDEADLFRSRYYKKYAGIPRYHERQSELVNRTGMVRSPMGRIRRLPAGMQSEDKYARGEAERQGINMPIQSHDSDFGLLGRLMFWNEIKSNPKFRGKVRPNWFIHDNVMYQAKENIIHKADALLKECMEVRSVEYLKKEFDITVGYPVESDAKVGPSWAALKKFK